MARSVCESYKCEAKIAERSHRVCADQISTLINSTPRLLFGAAITELLLVFALWGSVSATRIITWVLLLAVPQLLGTWLVRRYRQDPPQPQDVERWYWLFRLRSLLAGSAWGAGAFLLWVPNEPVLQGLVGLSLFGVVAAAVTVFPVVPSVFYAFVIPAFVPLVVRLVAVGDLLYICMGLFAFVMFLLTLASGRSFSRLTAQALAMRYENLDLIEELTEEKSVVEQAREDAERARLVAELASQAKVELIKELTEEKTIVEHAREDAERARIVAERANQAKSKFLAAASHDLRQPMHALGLYVAALRQRIQFPEVRELVNKIEASVSAMEELFNALLDVSKLDAGVVAPEISSFKLDAILERMELQYTAQAREKGIELRLRCSDVVVKSDATLLDRIIRNLISNAIRYTNRGGVLVGCRRRADRLRIEVWDTGVGIPEEQQREIFQEFVQLHNPERDRAKGLGLGLAIVQRLGKLLNHKVGVSSRPGKGSRFYVEVPLGDLRAAAVTMSPANEPISSTELDGAFVVVIDDEMSVLDSTKLLLEQYGCHVVTASSGEEAVTSLAKHDRTPDVIISDYRLRAGESGIDTIRLVQSAGAEYARGILITGDTAQDRITECSGCDFILLHKPLNPDRFITTVNEAVRQSNAYAAEALLRAEPRAAAGS